ncbi:MAG: flavin oxidoreductase/NADH oxidase [Ruminococcaceae bacterium]|nr:flavin oxidoreductase/NADH oxidase [Oscillospiraceae bacterium]
MQISLSDKISVYGREVHNRVLFQPMEGCDGTADGAVDELTRRRYLRFAEGSPGIIWFEATAVCNEGRANPRQLYINEKTVGSFKSLISEIKTKSTILHGFEPIIIVQLTHSGRYSKPDGTPEPIVAYRNELWEKGKEAQPFKVATDEYFDTIPAMYKKAAELALEAGFDGMDVKCCHGYLFNELLSAHNREGRYGGSLENRTRLYFNCIDAVKEAVGDKAFVTTRLNSCDCFPFGYGFGVNENDETDLTETKAIIEKLYEKGIELVNLTIGNPYLIPHTNRPYAAKSPEDGRIGMKRVYDVTKEITSSFPDMKFVVSALTYEGENAVKYAEKLLNEGVGDFAGFGRMTFAYPTFYKDYLKNGTLDKNKVCIKCSKCSELMRAGTVSGCVIRDSEKYMPYYREYVMKK